MRRMLKALEGAFTSKLHEHNGLHPCESDDGLLTLSHWLQKETVVFVRTVRHPLAIADSFVATRQESMRDRNPGLAQHDDERVVKFIRSESDGTDAQRDTLIETSTRAHKQWDHHLVEARYEDLANPGYRDLFALAVSKHMPDAGAAYRQLAGRLDAEWGSEPVRDGKLHRDITERVMGDERAAWFREQLQDIIEREGYE